ncbi:MAG: hypothetical protein ACLTDS_11940 [Bianqueaceae bacterium]
MKWNERYKEYLTDESGSEPAKKLFSFLLDNSGLSKLVAVYHQSTTELWGALPRWATAAIPERLPF